MGTTGTTRTTGTTGATGDVRAAGSVRVAWAAGEATGAARSSVVKEPTQKIQLHTWDQNKFRVRSVYIMS